MVSDLYPSGWFRPTNEGALIFVRVTPNAGRDRIEMPVELADGAVALKLRIAAPPADGRANDSVIAMIAKACRLPRSAFGIKSGATARNKTIALKATQDAAFSVRSALEAQFMTK